MLSFDLLTTKQVGFCCWFGFCVFFCLFLIKPLIFLSLIIVFFGWSKSCFSLIICWDERLWDTETVSLISDENIYERSDSFSLCYPSDDIFSECLRGTRHILFKQVPWTMILSLNTSKLVSETRNYIKQEAKQISKETERAQQQLSCESSWLLHSGKTGDFTISQSIRRETESRLRKNN